MQLVINLLVFIAWMVTARRVFRYLVHNEILKRNPHKCEHGYRSLHKGRSCYTRVPRPHYQVAAVAMIAATFFPFTFIYAAIVWKAPVGRTELLKTIDQLEEDNRRLRELNNGS